MNIQQKSKIIYNNCKDFKPFYADNDIEIVDTTEDIIFKMSLLD